MKKIICNKVYDTECASLLKKVTYGYFGEEEGYEEILYQTEGKLYFLYVNGFFFASPYFIHLHIFFIVLPPDSLYNTNKDILSYKIR